MRDIFRTEDIGEMTSVKAALESAAIKYLVLEDGLSYMPGLVSAWKFRVLETDFTAAGLLLKQLGFPLNGAQGPDVMAATLLQGRVELLQPRKGYHASIDAVFLAAAVSVRAGAHVLDIGCGVGSVGLCVLARIPDIRLTGLDIQPELIAIAEQNAVLNKVEARCRFVEGDLLKEKTIPDNAFSAVVLNPPYYEEGTASPRKNKAISHSEDVSGASLTDWVKYAHRKLKAGGHLVMIHRADRLDDAVLALESRRWFGSLVIYPLWSHAGEDAKRVILRARKERYLPLVLKSGLVIHEKTGEYTNGAQRILSAAEAIDLD